MENTSTTDLTVIEAFLVEQTVLLQQIYSAQLFFIGVAAALLVLWLLYRFLKLFY